MTYSAILWFRRDLRLKDNAALARVFERGGGVLPVYVMPTEPGRGETAWLLRSLASLEATLRHARLGSGDSARTCGRSAAHTGARESGARSVHCTRIWTPAGMDEEREVAYALAPERVGLIAAEGSLLVTPDAISTQRR
jgi:deoxyribodipyrimidine photo-lyase